MSRFQAFLCRIGRHKWLVGQFRRICKRCKYAELKVGNRWRPDHRAR